MISMLQLLSINDSFLLRGTSVICYTLFVRECAVSEYAAIDGRGRSHVINS